MKVYEFVPGICGGWFLQRGPPEVLSILQLGTEFGKRFRLNKTIFIHTAGFEPTRTLLSFVLLSPLGRFPRGLSIQVIGANPSSLKLQVGK